MGTIRVLHWYWRSGAGGIDRIVTDLVGRQEANPELSVAVATGDGLRFRHGFDFGRLGRVRQLLRDHDVIHMHVFNPVIALAARLLRKPVVYTDHGTDRDRRLRNLIVVWLLQRRFVRRHPALVTTNSRHMRADREAFYGRPVHLVTNGLSFPKPDGWSARRALGIAQDEFVVGTVAVFQRRKRIPLLLATFSDFCKAHPFTKARLLVVGDGPSADDLQRLADELDIAERTIFTGYRVDTEGLVRAMDVFVLPTRGEPFGLAAAEAAALERPVIVFRDGGGLTEIVRDGETGFVVKGVPQAVRRLGDLLVSPPLRRRLGQRGRADVLQRFDLARMEAELFDCYRQALG